MGMGCSFEPRKATVVDVDGSASCVGTTAQSLESIYPKYFANCRACHSAVSGSAGGLTFDNAAEFWQATVARSSQESPESLLVSPNYPDFSYLYLKLLPSATR